MGEGCNVPIACANRQHAPSSFVFLLRYVVCSQVATHLGDVVRFVANRVLEMLYGFEEGVETVVGQTLLLPDEADTAVNDAEPVTVIR